MLSLGRDPSTGQRQRLWLPNSYRTKREAEEALTAALAQWDMGGLSVDHRKSLSEYLDQWLERIEHSVRPSTLASYDMHIRCHIVPFLGDLSLRDLRPHHLESLYSRLQTSGRRDGYGLSPRSVQYTHRVLKMALKAARLGVNPADHVKPPKVPRYEFHTWSVSEVQQFLRYIDESRDRLIAMWLTFVTTGMRRGEVLGLRWADVDLDSSRLSVRQTLIAVGATVQFSKPKTDRSRRSVALDTRTIAVLRRHRAQQLEERLEAGSAWENRDLVFCREDGSPLDPNRTTRRFKALARHAGVPVIRLHETRHSWATLALQGGIPAKVVSDRLGHSSIAITLDTYSAVVPALQEDAAEQVAGLIFGMD